MHNLVNLCYTVKWSYNTQTDSQVIHLPGSTPLSSCAFCPLTEGTRRTVYKLIQYIQCLQLISKRQMSPPGFAAPVATFFCKLLCMELLEAQGRQMSKYFSGGNSSTYMHDVTRGTGTKGRILSD